MKHKHTTPFLYQTVDRGPLPVARLVRSHRSAAVLAMLIVILSMTTLAMLFAPWQQTSSGVGQTVAFNPLERRQILGASVKGRISRWHVTEGSAVKKGQLLATITDLDPQALERIKQERDAINEQIKIAKRRASAYSNKFKSLKSVRSLHFKANWLKIRMYKQKYKASLLKQQSLKAALRTATINLKRMRKLRKDQIVSNRKVEVSELKVTKLQMALSGAQASVLAAQSRIVEIQAQRMKKGAEDQSKIDSTDADVQKAMDKAAGARSKLAKLDLKMARQSAQLIRAPRDAVILRLLVSEGSEMLKAGDPIAVIVPQTSAFAVELWVDGNDTPLIQQGRHVRLQFEGWPAVQFTGWPSIAVGTFGGRVVLVDTMSTKNGKFRIVVTPDPKDQPWPKAPYLRQGIKAKGWILLDEVRLGYELWRQLNGFPPTVTPKDTKKQQKPLIKKAK